MGHPLSPNLTELTNEELNKKYNDLMMRMNTAFKWGNADMVGQLQLLMQDYQEELANRNRKMIEDLEKNSKNFKNIIDIK